MSDCVGEYVILRSRDQGVVFGKLLSLVTSPMGLGVASIEEARQLHYWSDANTLIEMSNYGCGQARISEPAEEVVIVFGVCGVLKCTAKAVRNLKQSRWNESAKNSD